MFTFLPRFEGKIKGRVGSRYATAVRRRAMRKATLHSCVGIFVSVSGCTCANERGNELEKRGMLMLLATRKLQPIKNVTPDENRKSREQAEAAKREIVRKVDTRMDIPTFEK